jgi:hypothetical protein
MKNQFTAKFPSGLRIKGRGIKTDGELDQAGTCQANHRWMQSTVRQTMRL